MGFRGAVRVAAGYYRKAARLLVVLALIGSLVAPALATQEKLSPALALSVVGFRATSCTSAGGARAAPLTTLSGGGEVIVSGNSFSGAIQFNGTIVWLLTGRIGQPWNFSSALNPSDFNSNPLQYPSKAKDNFSSSATHLGAADCSKPYGATVSVTATNAQPYTYNGKTFPPGALLLGTTSASASSTPTNNMFPMAVELPLFNATSLGVTVHCPPSTAPCQLPLEGFYSFVLVVAIILAGIGFLVALVNGSFGEKNDGGYAKPLLNTILAIFFIVLFPLIYNNVAAVINYLDMAVIAGPGNPYSAYSGNIQLLWDKLMTLTGGTLWGMFTSAILTVAAWIVGLIVWILVFILGIIRVFLVAVMVIAFPISLALKEMPFTKKLGSMVEDTLFGLMLASLMSAIVLGVAAYVLRQGTAGTILNGGGDNFVAAMALLLALLMPTVLAPLTGTLFQTASQAGMAAVGTATLLTAAGGMGVGGGVMGGMSPAALTQSGSLARSLGFNLSDPAQAQQFAAHVGTMSRGERLAAAVQHRTMLGGLASAIPAMMLSVGSVGLQGVLMGMGSVQAGKAIARLMPIQTSGRIAEGIQEKLGTRQQNVLVVDAQQSIARHKEVVGGIFSQVGSITPELAFKMKEKLGGEYLTPYRTDVLYKWWGDFRTNSAAKIVNVLSQHKLVDLAKYNSNKHYKDGVDNMILLGQQKLSEMNPEQDPANYAKVADLHNLLNYEPVKE